MKLYELENPLARKQPMHWTVDMLLYTINSHTTDDSIPMQDKGINLQRPYVWSLEDKQNFILSACERGTVGTFVINLEQDSSKLEIIDGKHRIKTLQEFKEGKFAVDNFHWDTMNSDERMYLNGLDAECYRLYNLTNDEKISMYLAVNHPGVPQDNKHLNELRSKLS